MKKGIFIIDYQNDFMDQPTAALPVTGAVKDVQRVSALLLKNPSMFDSVFATQDSHHPLDIAHPCWWKKADGSFVDPFTPILPEDLVSGKYYATIYPTLSNRYVNDLTAQGEYIHFIWPEHCIMGTPGHAFHEDFSKAIANWERVTNRWVNIVTKGSNPFTEHFGAVRANIPQANDPSTQISQVLLNQLLSLDVLYFTGQARSHCVANTLRQLMDECPNLLPKMIILEDGMSDVQGLPNDFYVGVQAIYDRAKTMGAKSIRTTDL